MHAVPRARFAIHPSSSLAPSCGGGGGKVAVLWFLNDLLLHRSLY
tara:strand:+ start:506 stop:640 length:135 start_codon:yes stop_codon:yes gene_type:complete